MACVSHCDCAAQMDAELLVAESSGKRWRIHTSSALSTQILQSMLERVVNTGATEQAEQGDREVKQGSWFRGGLSDCVGSTQELQLRVSSEETAPPAEDLGAVETPRHAALSKAYKVFKVCEAVLYNAVVNSYGCRQPTAPGALLVRGPQC